LSKDVRSLRATVRSNDGSPTQYRATGAFDKTYSRTTGFVSYGKNTVGWGVLPAQARANVAAASGSERSREVSRMSGIGDEFMEKTRYRHLGPSDQERGVPPPPPQALLGGGARLSLPDPAPLPSGRFGFRESLERRRSLREYAAKPLTLRELSYLLWCTQGITRGTPQRGTFRTVPSAGARHPLETVVLANRVDGLPPGLYQFLAVDRQLATLHTGPEFADRMTVACLGQEMVHTSAAVFIWVADSYRMTWRYGERGFRYLHIDAGHVCQNLYLAAESIDAGACAIGAFRDDEVNNLLDLDGRSRFAVYLAAVGKRSAAT
jgi:SagB-type dehydrogenase family enzyme